MERREGKGRVTCCLVNIDIAAYAYIGEHL